MDVAFGQEDFDKLKKKFEENETAFAGENMAALNSISFNRIIDAGERAIPFLLKEYQISKLPHWGLALHLITGEDPIKPESSNNFDLVQEDWIQWGKENKYI